MANVARPRWRGGPTLVALVMAAAVVLSACSSGSRSPAAGSSPASPPSSSPAGSAPPGSAPGSGDRPVVENTGIKVTGSFDTQPTVTLPAGRPPTQLVEQTLIAGRGTPVAAGDTVITNYVGEIWPAQAGRAAK